jgi:hypothetical protein
LSSAAAVRTLQNATAATNANEILEDIVLIPLVFMSADFETEGRELFLGIDDCSIPPARTSTRAAKS